jgi:hypothetical protein
MSSRNASLVGSTLKFVTYKLGLWILNLSFFSICSNLEYFFCCSYLAIIYVCVPKSALINLYAYIC